MPKRIFEHGRICNCATCEFKDQVQPWENFHKHKTSINGHNTHCKPCRRAIHLKNENCKLKTGKARKPKTLQSQCDLTWDANGAARFLMGKV
jgi:hypothetical protein